MKTLTIRLLDSVDEFNVKMKLAAHLFEKGIIINIIGEADADN